MKILSMYVYLSVENIMTNFRAIMVYVCHFGHIIYRKVIQLNCCKGNLNKALIDQKHVYVYCLFGTGWMRAFVFLNSSSKLKPGANKINIAIITTPL